MKQSLVLQGFLKTCFGFPPFNSVLFNRMNIKGLKLNKLLARKVYESIDSISVASLHGLESFVSFSWKGFSKEEFKNNLSLFVVLLDNGFFSSFDNDHTFVFNYSTDITEMDIVTVLTNGEKEVFLDIESKNGDDFENISAKVKTQIDKRKNDHMPQLLKDNSYIAVGFANNVFVCGFYFDGTQLESISSVDELFELMNSLKQSKGCEEYLIQLSNIASIAKICNDIRAGTFKYYEETNRIYNSLIGGMSSSRASIIYGNAGTGKSILALKLLFELPKTKILLMNSKLYYALSLNDYYKSGRTTFNTEQFLDLIDDETISIIDECQRVSVEYMAKVIEKSKHTFLFGDNKQAFTRKGTLKNQKDLSKALFDEYGLKSSYRVIRKAKRYSDEVSKALNLLTTVDPNPNDCKLPDDYKINLFLDEDTFLKAYESTNGIKKIYMPLYGSHFHIKIGEKEFERALYNDDSFSLWNYKGDYYGTTYHALSFDVDHCFVALKNAKMATIEGKKVPYYDGYYSSPSFDDIQIYLNELNILFTRGRKSLNICINDIETYLYFNNLINKIK